MHTTTRSNIMMILATRVVCIPASRSVRARSTTTRECIICIVCILYLLVILATLVCAHLVCIICKILLASTCSMHTSYA